MKKLMMALSLICCVAIATNCIASGNEKDTKKGEVKACCAKGASEGKACCKDKAAAQKSGKDGKACCAHEGGKACNHEGAEKHTEEKKQ